MNKMNDLIKKLDKLSVSKRNDDIDNLTSLLDNLHVNEEFLEINKKLGINPSFFINSSDANTVHKIKFLYILDKMFLNYNDNYGTFIKYNFTNHSNVSILNFMNNIDVLKEFNNEVCVF